MEPGFRNVYQDDRRADAYSELEFPGSYFLAFRDLPDIFSRNVNGRRALDFGCGTGRSSRFLKDLGYQVLGVDISEPMLARARERDPQGEYESIPNGSLGDQQRRRFDLVLSTFTFDNIPDPAKRLHLFKCLRDTLSPDGRIVNLVSAPEIYLHEWASFSTKDFPENRAAKSGDPVRIVMLDVPDRRPVEDVLWTDSDYRELYRSAGLGLLEVHRPVGKPSDPCRWVYEAQVSPWVIYVLGAGAQETKREGDSPP